MYITVGAQHVNSMSGILRTVSIRVITHPRVPQWGLCCNSLTFSSVNHETLSHSRSPWLHIRSKYHTEMTNREAKLVKRRWYKTQLMSFLIRCKKVRLLSSWIANVFLMTHLSHAIMAVFFFMLIFPSTTLSLTYSINISNTPSQYNENKLLTVKHYYMVM